MVSLFRISCAGCVDICSVDISCIGIFGFYISGVIVACVEACYLEPFVCIFLFGIYYFSFLVSFYFSDISLLIFLFEISLLNIYFRTVAYAGHLC